MDVLYIFNFEEADLPEALRRFRFSLESIARQNVRICISNNSEVCVRSEIEDLIPRIAYVHKPYRGLFSRAHGINYGVRTLVESEYFIISDVDLVYRQNHIENVRRKMSDAACPSSPLRLVFWNYNLEPRYRPAWMNRRLLRRFASQSPREESSDYERLMALPSKGGFAHGNGVIHLESFLRLRGYDEEMIGYGPEDDLFNTRIGRVNKIVYDDSTDTASIHLWHRRLRMIQHKKNMEIWRKRKACYNTLPNPSWDDLTANKNSRTWGEI